MDKRANLDTLLACNECGRELWTSFERLNKKWPRCCGFRMEIVASNSDFDQDVDRLLRKPKVRLKSKYTERRYIP